MARVVIIVDSNTGSLIDVAGNVREGGRYAKFAKRILSEDRKNIDYNDTLTISSGGSSGSAINLLADVVNVSDIRIGGKTVKEIASGAAAGSLEGKEGEVVITEKTVSDPSTGASRNVTEISLDESVMSRLALIDTAIGGLSNVVRKSDIVTAVQDLTGDLTSLEQVEQVLSELISRLAAIGGDVPEEEEET